MTDIAMVRATTAPGRLPTSFDSALVLGVAALSLFVVAAYRWTPDWFLVLLVADLWLLGYHHVIATFTRFAGPQPLANNRKSLLLALPPGVLAGTALLAYAGGIVAVVTVYFHWQWYHYVRQSWGISRFLRARSATAPESSTWLSQAALWGIPITGLLHRSSEGHLTFLFMPVRMLPVPTWLVFLAAAVAIAALSVHVVRELRIARSSPSPQVSKAYFGFLASHHAVFAIAYIAIDDINWGWLTINVWHNAQYLLFVWAFNVNRAAKGDARKDWFAWLCDPKRMLLYFGATLLVTTIVYQSLLQVIGWLDVATATLALVVVFQTLNFHHYIVDSVIWKRPKPTPARAHLQGA